MSTVTGYVNYRALDPAVSWDVWASDGSVPYGITTNGHIAFQDTGAGMDESRCFSLIGSPRVANVAIGTGGSLQSLTKTVSVILRDLTFVVSGGAATYDISVAVGSPEDFPDSDDTTFLYRADLIMTSTDTPVVLKVPEISHLVVAASETRELNVLVRIRASLTNARARVSFHCNCIVDD